MIDVYKIIENTSVEGPGNRFCIWVQGCKKHCKNCWAKETWEFDIGQKYSVEKLFDIIKKQEGIEGITFLGGEPFEQAKELSKLAQMCQKIGLSILTFSGYTLEELKNKNDEYVELLLNHTDLLIDGGFEYENYDLSRPWVGSSNQKYHFLSTRYNEKDLAKYKNKIEIRLNTDGKLEINGMGDFGKFKKDFCLQLGKNIVE